MLLRVLLTSFLPFLLICPDAAHQSTLAAADICDSRHGTSTTTTTTTTMTTTLDFDDRVVGPSDVVERREGAAKRADQPHDWKVDDQMRVLTAKGVAQCEAAAKWFGALDVAAVLSSPARRASETAMRICAQVETEEKKEATLYLRMVPAVHPAGMSEPCEKLFDDLGYGPLRLFFDAGGEDAFQAYADDAAAELAAAIRGLEDCGGGSVAVFGHAVFLNAIAFKLAQAAGYDDANQALLLDMDLGETEGIHIPLATGQKRIRKLTAAKPSS